MYAYCQEMPGVTEEVARAVEAEVGAPPYDGLVAHVSGPARGGWRIIDVWESEDAYRRFAVERLGPAVQRVTEGAPDGGSAAPFELVEVRDAAEPDPLSRLA